MRARSVEAKGVRRAQIRAAAVSALLRDGWEAVRMEAVAKDAGVAKGTVYLYWPTREALFLDVVAEEYAAWWAEVAAALPSVPATSGGVAALLVRSVAPREALLALVGLLHVVLEQNVDHAHVLAFKQSLLDGGLAAAAALHAHLPWLSVPDAARFLMRVHATLVAVRPMSQPPPIVAQVLSDEAFAPLRVDFAPELEALWTDLLEARRAAALSPSQEVP